MSTETVFSIANILVMPMWVLMIFLPNWKWTTWLVDFKLVPIILALIYAVYITIAVSGGSEMDFSSLESVMNLFKDEQAVLAGWVHYLVFDLLVGMWCMNQNKSIGINSILMGVCLLGCFMLGPIGFLLFLVFKRIKQS
ncbi:MAG: DUF4281 domain-containing protein [Bacteroidia bacterium]|nr:DUF4281 domain-containing protein [Bacteroidia bacterium]